MPMKSWPASLDFVNEFQTQDTSVVSQKFAVQIAPVRSQALLALSGRCPTSPASAVAPGSERGAFAQKAKHLSALFNEPLTHHTSSVMQNWNFGRDRQLYG
jgi:hypothetical protein